MKRIRAEIAELEHKLAGYDEYKKEHPGTHKSPSDPMFHPAYGQTKPHLPHEELSKLHPKEHERLSKEHKNHSQQAQKLVHEARRSGNKEQQAAAQDLAFKHHDVANMHDMYALARYGKDEKLRSQAAQKAKQYHGELTKA